MRIVFFGTSTFASSILEHISKEFSENIIAVVTKPDKPVGRGQKLQMSPVKKGAKNLLPHVPILQPERVSTKEAIDQLKRLSPDLFIVVAFGEILKKEVLALPAIGAFNIHASLLPAYRGAAPIQRVLMDGASHTGITIFRLNPKMDSGDVVWKKSCAIGEDETAGELTARLLETSKEGVVELLHQAIKNTLTFSQQPQKGMSLAPKLLPEDLMLDQSWELQKIHNHVRALSPKPGSYFLVAHHGEKKRLKIVQTHIDSTAPFQGKGWFKTEDGKLSLSDSKKALIIDTLQLEGRRAMSSEEFLRGVSLEDLRFF